MLLLESEVGCPLTLTMIQTTEQTNRILIGCLIIESEKVLQ